MVLNTLNGCTTLLLLTAPVVQTSDSAIHQAPVVEKLDSTIHQIIRYTVDNKRE